MRISEKLVTLSYTLLRVVSGVMFLQAGSTKILGWFGGMPPGVSADVGSQTWIGGMLELVGGTLIVLGLLTRPVAFVLCGEMAVAYWQFHAPEGTWPAQNAGVPAVLYCFVFLFMAAYGGGAWSLDGVIGQKKQAKQD